MRGDACQSPLGSKRTFSSASTETSTNEDGADHRRAVVIPWVIVAGRVTVGRRWWRNVVVAATEAHNDRRCQRGPIHRTIAHDRRLLSHGSIGDPPSPFRL